MTCCHRFHCDYSLNSLEDMLGFTGGATYQSCRLACLNCCEREMFDPLYLSAFVPAYSTAWQQSLPSAISVICCQHHNRLLFFLENKKSIFQYHDGTRSVREQCTGRRTANGRPCRLDTVHQTDVIKFASSNHISILHCTERRQNHSPECNAHFCNK